MKKMMIALVAMVMMTMSANAQSVNNDSQLTFNRMSNYLELTINQIEPVKKAMAQFTTSVEVIYQMENASKANEAWLKIQANHKAKMKQILNEKQYNKYTQMLDLTAQNTAERISQQMTASK